MSRQLLQALQYPRIFFRIGSARRERLAVCALVPGLHLKVFVSPSVEQLPDLGPIQKR